MRIAMFFSYFPHYIVGRCRAAIEEASRQKHELILYAMAPKSNELPINGYQHLLGGQVTVLTDQSDPRVESAESTTVIQALDKDRPDVVAIPGYSSRYSRGALGWCRFRRCGAILMSESQAVDFSRSALLEFLKARLVACFDAALVGGTPHKAYISQLGMHSDRVFTGYDVVDNCFWAGSAERVHSKPELWRQRFHLPQRFFLAASRFVPKKNLDGLLRAYKRYVEQAADQPWHLVIAGNGSLERFIHNLISDLKLWNLVHLLGYLAADEMAPVYGLATVFVHASSHSEQWGLVVNEAMAARLPVLVSEICGCASDLVIEGVTGYTFDSKDEKSLAELMLFMHSREADLERMGKAAQDHIGNYSPELFARNLLRAAEVAVEYAKRRHWFPWPPPKWWL